MYLQYQILIVQVFRRLQMKKTVFSRAFNVYHYLAMTCFVSYSGFTSFCTYCEQVIFLKTAIVGSALVVGHQYLYMCRMLDSGHLSMTRSRFGIRFMCT